MIKSFQKHKWLYILVSVFLVITIVLIITPVIYTVKWMIIVVKNNYMEEKFLSTDSTWIDTTGQYTMQVYSKHGFMIITNNKTNSPAIKAFFGSQRELHFTKHNPDNPQYKFHSVNEYDYVVFWDYDDSFTVKISKKSGAKQLHPDFMLGIDDEIVLIFKRKE